ncbi:hypothetical protein GCM10009634_21930 [Saccharothrix xinjiangensis]
MQPKPWALTSSAPKRRFSTVFPLPFAAPCASPAVQTLLRKPHCAGPAKGGQRPRDHSVNYRFDSFNISGV